MLEDGEGGKYSLFVHPAAPQNAATTRRHADFCRCFLRHRSCIRLVTVGFSACFSVDNSPVSQGRSGRRGRAFIPAFLPQKP